jgi:hypothetical protein
MGRKRDSAANSLTALRDFNGLFESSVIEKPPGGGRPIRDPRSTRAQPCRYHTRAVRAHNAQQPSAPTPLR